MVLCLQKRFVFFVCWRFRFRQIAKVGFFRRPTDAKTKYDKSLKIERIEDSTRKITLTKTEGRLNGEKSQSKKDSMTQYTYTEIEGKLKK